jgi:hypothetical protein
MECSGYATDLSKSDGAGGPFPTDDSCAAVKPHAHEFSRMSGINHLCVHGIQHSRGLALMAVIPVKTLPTESVKSPSHRSRQLA